MNVIIIDNSKRSMQIMRRFLAKGIPDVAVTEYDPDQRGTPPHAFDWAEYDTLLLSQDLGAAGTGLQWLEDYGSSANFPPTIIVAQKDDPQVTSNALKLGAHSVITKRDLTPDNLGRLVQEASVAEPVKREGAGDRKDNSADAEIVAQAQGPEGEGYKITRLIGQGAMVQGVSGRPAGRQANRGSQDHGRYVDQRQRGGQTISFSRQPWSPVSKAHTW